MTVVDFLWLLLFGSIAVASLPMSQRYLGHWFTPLSIYVGANALSMACYHLRRIPMIEVSASVHLLLLGSLVMFVVGTATAVRRGVPAAVAGPIARSDLARMGVFFYWTAGLAVAGSSIATAIMVGDYGIGGLIDNIWALQDEFQMQYIGYLNLLGILVLPAYVLRRTLGGTSGRTRTLDLVLVAAALFGLLLAGIKSYMVRSVLAAFLVWSVRRPAGFKVWHLTVGGLVLVAYFAIYTHVIDIFVPDTDQYTGISGALSFLHRPFLYFVGAWPALEQMMHGAVESMPRIGYVTLQPAWKILEAFGLAGTLDKYMPFVNIGYESFNVYSFAGEVYYDWGWVGAMLGSFLLGYVSVRCYLRAKFAAYWGHALVYGIVGYGVFLTPFSYLFKFNMMFHLLYVYLLGFFLLRGGVFIDRRHRA